MKRWVVVVLLMVAGLVLSGCMHEPSGPELLFTDYFANADSPGWWQGLDSDTGAQWQITGGHYVGQIADADSYYYVWNTEVTGLTDFRIQATTSQIGTATDHSWGIIFRTDGDSLYAFEISADGGVLFSVRTPSDWNDLYGWAPCAAIHPAGQTNELRVDAHGTSFALYVNDRLVTQVTDATLSSGSVGFIVETWDDPNGGAWFDDLEVWTLED
ncbi:MAG: hypothetical protein NTV92_09465 [Candidatus Bipolaricaulota bacterium]|nr:hypothetical protein [Candidatus Bipolaricaulota bacterium]